MSLQTPTTATGATIPVWNTLPASTEEAPTLASLHWMLLSFFSGRIYTNHRISPSVHKLYFCCLGKHSQTETSFEMNFLSPFLCIALTLTLSLPDSPHCHSKNDQQKCQILNHYSCFFPPSHEHVERFLSKFTVLKVVVIRPSNILSASMYVCTFHPRNFTGWGSEGIKLS